LGECVGVLGERADERGDLGDDFRFVEDDPDDARRSGKHFVVARADRLGDGRGRLLCGGDAGFARARVRASAVDENGARAAGCDASGCDVDRRGANQVGREDRAGRSRVIGDGEGEIFALVFLQASVNAGETKAGDDGERVLDADAHVGPF